MCLCFHGYGNLSYYINLLVTLWFYKKPYGIKGYYSLQFSIGELFDIRPKCHPDSVAGGAIPMVSGELLVVSGFKSVVGGEEKRTISLEDLPQDKIKELIKRLSEIRKKKYLRCKETRYGNLCRAFSEEELRNFFKCCKNPRAFLAFKIMAYLGLRVGEVAVINIDDIDFNKHKLRINTEKAKTIDYLFIHSEVRKLLFEWCEKFQEEILAHNGFILSPDTNGNSKNNHISPNWLRKEFRDVCLLANLNESYGQSNNYIGGGKYKDRRLFRLTTHNLRHYYIDKVYKSCKDPLKTQKLARHQDFKSTQVYIHLKQEDIDKTLKDVFENEGINIKEDEMHEFITFFNMWKNMKEKS